MNKIETKDPLFFIDEKYIEEAKFERKRAKIITPKKIGAIFVAAVILLISVIPVLAYNDVKPAYELVYSVSPELAQRLKPVKKSCVSNGIQMEVVSASVKNDTAEVLIAVKDIEKDRIDGTIDLFDSYDIKGIKDCSGTCRLESFDKESKTALFLIYIQQMNDKKIDLNKITFSVSKMLSQKKKITDFSSAIDLKNMKKTCKKISKKTVEFRGGETEKINPVLPQKNSISDITNGIHLSALCYDENQLHIQILYDDILRTDNHGYVTLIKKDGEEIYGKDVAFWDEAHKGSYEEYVFDIYENELADCTVGGEITACDTLIEGDWEVTFPIS